MLSKPTWLRGKTVDGAELVVAMVVKGMRNVK
jgi:hypothetical protein